MRRMHACNPTRPRYGPTRPADTHAYSHGYLSLPHVATCQHARGAWERPAKPQGKVTQRDDVSRRVVLPTRGT